MQAESIQAKLREKDEIEHARYVHTKFAEHVEKEEIILRQTKGQICHKVGKSREVESMIGALAEATDRRASTESINIFASCLSRAKWWDEWQSLADDRLLFKMLEEGCIPEFFDSNRTEEPPNFTQVYKRAKERGYNVPQRYLDDGRPVGYAEHEAWAAAVSLMEGSGFFWKSDYHCSWRRSVWNLSGQFIIPDPLEEGRPPYAADQLWIVPTEADKVRFLILEIDEPIHFSSDERKKGRKRDVMLAAMGYEVYHVPAWWCAVDPYRVIAEFITAAGLCSKASRSFVGHEFRTIAEYVCDHCDEPMVRWDDDWIMELHRRSGSPMLVHKQCLDDAR